jgi:hypothetical protein
MELFEIFQRSTPKPYPFRTEGHTHFGSWDQPIAVLTAPPLLLLA